MAHKWDQPVNRHVEHSVTCTLCGVFVERVLEGNRGVNYNTVLGGERSRGLAPRCPGKIAVDEVDPNQTSLFDLTLAADVAPEQSETQTETEAEVEVDDETDDDENEGEDELAASCEKYEAMTRKELDKLAAGLVKNYKKLSKDALAFELALKGQQTAAHAA